MRKVLNLTKHLEFNFPSINYKHFNFPSGEDHIKIDVSDISHNDNVIIASTLQPNIMTTLLATNVIKYKTKNIELFCPFLPYARQDRVMVPGEPFSLKVLADTINNQNYNKVHVLDPHSEVTTALINNINIIPNNIFIKTAWQSIQRINPDKELYLVSPDAGALKKCWKIVETLGLTNLVQATKNRNVNTGRITETQVFQDVKDKICVIVDDIIDGGATFINLARVLKEKGASKVYLIVSHGIFSKKYETLKILDGIYATDSFQVVDDPLVTLIPIHTF